MKSISAFIIIFSIITLSIFNSCRDIAFNNPLDPNASKEVLKVIRVIDTPFGGRGDATFDGEKLWKINLSGELIAFDRETGTLIRSFLIMPGTGICFSSNVLYLCNGQAENILYKVDPMSGDILENLSTRNIYPGYLAALTENQLIIYDVRSSGIFSYDPSTGNSIRLFGIAGISVGGIEVYGNSLLVTDMNSGAIYQFTMDGTVMNVFLAPASGIGGVTVDNSDYIYLFMMDGKIYKVSLP